MLFSSLNSLVLGLALSVAVDAVPSQYSHGRRAELIPRGVPDSAHKLRFMPRDGKTGKGSKNNGKGNRNDIQIEVIDITEIVTPRETELEIRVTDILIRNRSNNKKKDKKRKEYAKNKKNNNGDNVNVVIQVVQVIIDIRDDSNKQTRYATHDMTIDNGSDETTTQLVTDSQTMTVYSTNACTDNSNGTSIATATEGSNDLVLSDATATATALMAASTDDVAAPYLQNNQTTLCPPGTEAPQAPEGGSVIQDPAWEITQEIIAAAEGSQC